MTALRVYAKAEDAQALPATLRLEDTAPMRPAAGQVVIQVRFAGVNPSDVKAVLGAMPHAIWPRTPGRDYAGVVVDGPAEWIGREVWGSSGELGIRRDGTHASHLLLDVRNIREKPSTMTMAEAASVGVPFVTASEGLAEAGGVKPGDVLLVLGANGKVGQAAIQIAAAAGARVFGVERTLRAHIGYASAPVTMLSGAEDFAMALRDATAGHGADIVFNTVGSPYFATANRAMAVLGRQIFIATIDRAVPFDIFAFYRGRHRYIGLDTLALDSGHCAGVLDTLRPSFESGALRAFPVPEDNIYPLARAAAAYQAVLAGAPDRIVLAPD
jgi:NADPH:quinone reductase-like Zn-dependent oxidoreductase